MSLSEKAETLMQNLKTIFKTSGLGTRSLLFKDVFEYCRNNLSDARQEIEDCKISWQNLKDTIPKFEAKISFLENQIKSDQELIEISQYARHKMQRERGEQKQKLRDKIIRLLQIRAGGHYQMFEAGMIYQCLMLLGMPEYTRHKQVDALVKVTRHYLHESNAKKQLEELLKE